MTWDNGFLYYLFAALQVETSFYQAGGLFHTLLSMLSIRTVMFRFCPAENVIPVYKAVIASASLL